MAGAPRYFLCRLVPPRPTFALDMSAGEKEIMARHAEYLRTQLARRRIVVFGPVLDPKGAWGVAVARVADEDELRAILAQDPAIQAAMGMSYETYPMATAVHG